MALVKQEGLENYTWSFETMEPNQVDENKDLDGMMNELCSITIRHESPAIR